MQTFGKHEHLEVPPWNTTLWRYMGMAKFLDLVLHRRLLFVSASKFSDGYEVTLPPNIVKLLDQFKAGQIEDPDVAKILSGFKFEDGIERDKTLVNCWTLQRSESYAHWKIYLGGDKAGVAIRTNFKGLKSALFDAGLNHDVDIYAGRVNYSDTLPVKKLSDVRIITTKREFYRYESELRLFIRNATHASSSASNHGQYVHVGLDNLIDKIYVSPFVGSWFFDVLKETLQKIEPNLCGKVIASSINDQ